jgi:cell division protein FtsQ
MATKKNIKRIMLHTAWVVLAVALVVISIAAIQKKKNSICKEIKVNILSNREQLFLSEEDILSLLQAKEIVNTKTIAEIDIKAMERNLEKNVWIDKAELYFDNKNILHADVIERSPYFRIFRQNGNSFYMDKQHFVLPLSNAYSARVPIFTGFPNNATLSHNDTLLLESMDKMAAYINTNPFWMAQIQQLNIVHTDEFEIMPTIGKHLVLFGDTTAMEDKFRKLYRFYKTVSTKAGFDKFSVLNIKFKNQIVATNNNYLPIDSSRASAVIEQFIKNNSDSVLQIIDTAQRSSNNANIVDTARTVNTAAPKPVATSLRPVTVVAVPPKKPPVKRTNTINNPPKRTIPPRAIMPPKRSGTTRPHQ